MVLAGGILAVAGCVLVLVWHVWRRLAVPKEAIEAMALGQVRRLVNGDPRALDRESLGEDFMLR